MGIKIGLIGAQGRLGKAIAALYPIVPILRGTSRKNTGCDVLIDVSSPEALAENLSAGLPIVVGTTGIDFRLIEEAAKRLPVFYTPNFSLGVALLHKLAPLIDRAFQGDVDLIETHRKGKRDAPSGTALSLAKILQNATTHSIRSGEVMGKHQLIFNNAEEQLVLSHEAHSRSAFAKGAIAAAQFLVGKPVGLYGMDNLFSEELSSLSYARSAD